MPGLGTFCAVVAGRARVAVSLGGHVVVVALRTW